MKTKILYIEDEPHLARIVSETLLLKGYEVLHRKDGTRLLEQISSFNPDVCLFDVMLPHIDGFSLGSMVRNIYQHLPIIFITAKSQTQDVLEGFSSGGTDYIKKPFSMEELMVRIENQVKLTKSKTPADQSLNADIKLGQLIYSPSKLELQGPTSTIKLSNREVEIMNVLCMHQNQPIERRKLLQVVWGDDSFFNSRNLDVYIRKLREYFAASPGLEIITLKGKGYHFIVS